MTGTITGLLWGLLALGGGQVVPAVPGDSIVGPGDAVPFIAQTPLLCGGAAAAMIERHHGARGVYGNDYAHLVRQDEGGIRAADLVSALRSRGYSTRVTHGDPAAARAALEAGLPPIILLEGGEPALHYVVLVAMDDHRVWVHDPNWGPSRSMLLREVVERWAASGFWMVTALDRESAVERGESPNARADDPTRPPSPAVDSAMALLRAGAFAEARGAVAPLRGGVAGGDLAWRITATSYYLEDAPLRALDAWNQLDEPPVDLVGIGGLRHTRYHVLRRRMDIRDGEVLRSADLRLARRRVEAVPSVRRSRVSFQPIANGDVEVRAEVLEGNRWPGRFGAAAALVTAVTRRGLRAEAGPFFSGGDRWSVGGSWHPAREELSFSAAMPAPPVPGIVRVGVDWRRESHQELPVPDERVRGELGISEWVTPDLRIGGTAGLERWADGPRRWSAGAELRWLDWDDRLTAEVGVERWEGDDAGFAQVQSMVGLRIPVGESHEWRARAGWASVSEAAPRLLWPGAGSGRFRDILLRAHPLAVDESLEGATLAPSLAHAGLEYRAYRPLGPVRVGALVFADGAMVPSWTETSNRHSFLDLGLGAVVDLAGDEAQLTLAHGEAGWVLSARVLRREAW